MPKTRHLAPHAPLGQSAPTGLLPAPNADLRELMKALMDAQFVLLEHSAQAVQANAQRALRASTARPVPLSVLHLHMIMKFSKIIIVQNRSALSSPKTTS